MTPRVKICCISSPEEARLAISAGASALGLVGKMPSGPGIISDEMIRTIASIVPPGVASFLLTSETEAGSIIQHHESTRTNTIQLVDDIPDKLYEELKTAMPSVRLVQVIHVLGIESLDEALRKADFVDALLLDSGNPNLPVRELGGTGRVHNWEVSAKIVEQSKVPVYLAGGLNPGNVQAAIDRVRPFGLDLCSGVRTNGQLDPQKLESFFRVLKNDFQ
jgi:phosphoribosylanthranilate isomerase